MNVDIRLRHLFYRGDRKTVEVRTYTSRQRTTIRDLTGAELRWILAPAKGQAPTLEKTTAPGGGITITGTFNADPAVNTQVVVIEFVEADTAELAAGKWWHQLRRTDVGATLFSASFQLLA
jgi:hypothetical protein